MAQSALNFLSYKNVSFNATEFIQLITSKRTKYWEQ